MIVTGQKCVKNSPVAWVTLKDDPLKVVRLWVRLLQGKNLSGYRIQLSIKMVSQAANKQIKAKPEIRVSTNSYGPAVKSVMQGLLVLILLNSRIPEVLQSTDETTTGTITVEKQQKMKRLFKIQRLCLAIILSRYLICLIQLEMIRIRAKS